MGTAENQSPSEPGALEPPAGGSAPSEHELYARLCRDGWPLTLIKAVDAPGEYVAHTVYAGALRFTRATPGGDGWVRLTLAEPEGPGEWRALRGEIDVRLEDVRLVAEE